MYFFVPDENVENMEVIQDLERRIDEAEKDLQVTREVLYVVVFVCLGIGI